MSKRPEGRPTNRSAQVARAPDVVDPRWLIQAFLVMVAIALVCGYLTLCGLFYRGQWQLMLHPARTSAVPSVVAGMPIENVRFAADATGIPQLTGWWIPARTAAAYGSQTILYLRGGDGSLADDQARLAELHELGLTVFAIDYRGFGQSSATHPDERSMRADADSAWVYMTGLRGLRSDRIIPYGTGLGASVALGLAAEKAGVCALILDQPDFGVVERVKRDPRSRLIPVDLLLRDRFALEPQLSEVRVPKLILSRGAAEDPAVHTAADPKLTATLRPGDDAQLEDVLRRFLDEYGGVTFAPSLPLVPGTANGVETGTQAHLRTGK